MALSLHRIDARKLIASGVAIALNVGIVSVFLHISSQTATQRAPPEEEVIWLPPPPPKPPVPVPDQRKPSARTTTPRATPQQLPPDYRGITIPAPAPDLGGLNRTLFGCTGQDLEKLSPEERAHCAGSLFAAHPNNSVDFRDHSDRARQAALWARGLARKNGPLLLPCMNPQAAGVSLATLACLAKSASDGGFDPDNQPGYGDVPEPVQHIPNNGDPPGEPP